MSGDLPTGTVTLLFTDVEGSTKLLHELGAEQYAAALLEHRRQLRDAFARHGGVEVDTEGDAFFVVFSDADAAVAAAAEAQDVLGDGPIRIRVGLHTGTPHVTEQGYVGSDVHLGARIGAAGHGGQVLLSAATCDALVGPVQLTDLGEHRLKDFNAPIWIYQLGSASFPPLKSISNTNLPRPASTFVGREREVREITELLRDRARLLTLTGPGGTGKTRLSLEAAAELVPDFRNGTFWVELAPLTDAALVAPTIAATIGAKDDLAEHVGQREMLLVLDNLEQVVSAAPELGQLVDVCPNLRVLATSRERLRVQSEVEYSVPPLGAADAVALFCERTQLPPDDPIAQLCRRLDHLPLAIELAAARASVMSPSQMLDRLARRLDLLKGGRDTVARQQTLRATIEWSHELLDDDEKRLFTHLAVFSGGWTLDAAEAVCDADNDVLQSLVDKSLVRHVGERFNMLETIREYAAERLERSGEFDELRRRHAHFFVELARRAEPFVRAESSDWLDSLELEQDNLRAALDALRRGGDDDQFVELVASAWWLWSARGPSAEGRRNVDAALSKVTERPRLRAQLLVAAADFAVDRDDIDTARGSASDALDLYRLLNDEWGEAISLLALGLSFTSTDDWRPAQENFARSVELFERVGDAHWMLQALRRLAWAHESLGERERARELWEEALSRSRSIGDVFGEARALSVLVAYDMNDECVTPNVAPMLVAAHKIHRQRRDIPDQYWDAVLLCRFAYALALLGEAALPAALLARFDARVAEIEVTREPWLIRANELTRSMIRPMLTDEALTAAEQRGRRLTIDEAVDVAADRITTILKQRAQA
jgi:predicted ATPase